MYFDLDNGISTEQGTDPCLHRADSFVWFSYGSSLVSVVMTNSQLEDFCQLLIDATMTKDYIDREDRNDLYIALEEEDEGYRNICFYTLGVGLTVNLKVSSFTNLVEYFRNAIKLRLEEDVNV